MILMFIIRLVELVLGILINIYIGNIVKILFKKDGTFPRLPIRFIGIWLVINGLSWILNNPFFK